MINWHPTSLGLPQRRALPRLLARDQGCITLPGILFLAAPSYQSFRFPWQRLEFKSWGKGQKKKKASLRRETVGKAGPRSCHATPSATTHPSTFSNTLHKIAGRLIFLQLQATKKNQLQGNLFFNSSTGIYFISRPTCPLCQGEDEGGRVPWG